MGLPGQAYDNALVESFFASLETELIDRSRWPTQAEARLAVFDWIERFYNRIRRHSAIGYLTPGRVREEVPLAESRHETHRPRERVNSSVMLRVRYSRPTCVALGRCPQPTSTIVIRRRAAGDLDHEAVARVGGARRLEHSVAARSAQLLLVEVDAAGAAAELQPDGDAGRSLDPSGSPRRSAGSERPPSAGPA